jgi:hypothetical protein
MLCTKYDVLSVQGVVEVKGVDAISLEVYMLYQFPPQCTIIVCAESSVKPRG